MTNSRDIKPTGANAEQVGGDHYKKHGVLQHWDVVAHFKLDYMQGQILRYVMRWRDKNGIEDLRKAAHYLQKYIEIETAQRNAETTMARQRVSYGTITFPDGSEHVWVPSEKGKGTLFSNGWYALASMRDTGEPGTGYTCQDQYVRQTLT
jgi:Protein of unknwon function (DUF3310)